MRVAVHVVGGTQFLQRGAQRRAIHADIQIQCPRTLEQAVQVFVDKRPVAVMQPEPFPDAIAHQKAAVVDTYRGLGPRHDATIDVDEDIRVALVFLGLVGGLVIGHGMHPAGNLELLGCCCRTEAGTRSYPARQSAGLRKR